MDDAGPGSSPVAVVVAGAPGSGKSTVGRALAPRLGAVLMDLDTTMGAIVAAIGERWRPDLRAATYGGLVAAAAENAALGRHVVLVAPFTHERRDALAFEALAAALAPAVSVLVFVRCPAPVVLARLRARGARRDAVKLADPERWLASARPEDPPVVAHFAVDGTTPAEAVAADLVDRLGPARLG